jgi:hypothetical protein
MERHYRTIESTKVAEKFSVFIHEVTKSFFSDGLLPSAVVGSILGTDGTHQDECVSLLFSISG